MNRPVLFFIVIIFFLLVSCISSSTIKQDIYYNSGKKEKGVFYKINLQELEIHSTRDTASVKENCQFILALLINKYTQEKKTPSAVVKEIYASLYLKEDIFTRDFENFNTVSLEIELFNSTDKSSAMQEISALYTEETKNTIASYTYLYTILERLFNKIFY